jgi:hypothetical protein
MRNHIISFRNMRIEWHWISRHWTRSLQGLLRSILKFQTMILLFNNIRYITKKTDLVQSIFLVKTETSFKTWSGTWWSTTGLQSATLFATWSQFKVFVQIRNRNLLYQQVSVNQRNFDSNLVKQQNVLAHNEP